VSAIHFTIAPGVVVALVPWWLTGWQAAEPMPVAWHEAYRQQVPGWLPRTRPWQPGDPG
jgi:hypothetical protein